VRSFLLFILLAGIYSCTGTDPSAGKQLSGSDSLVINFNKPQSNMIEKTNYTTDKNAISKMARFVDGKKAEAYKCGYDGNLLFYKDGELLGDVSFNYSGEGCHHFIMKLGEELIPTAMSDEAADFLKSMAEGRNWY
jgi:hypothetical protein